MKTAASKVFTVIFVFALTITYGCGRKPEAPPDDYPAAEKTDYVDEAPKDTYNDFADDDYGNPLEGARGMNIGNALESPKNVFWGVEMRDVYFDYIKDAGFDTVRLPVRFSDYATGENYKLEEAFMLTVDYYIKYGLERGLNVVLVFHHFEQIMFDPLQSKDKFLSVWRQLAYRYKDYPGRLVFEVLNEPKERLGGELWNEFLAEAVSVIREIDPDRHLVVGADSYNSVEGLERLTLPDTGNLIVTFHYYVPNDFAFQGNQYHIGFEHLSNIEWTGTEEEMTRLLNDFTKVKNWAEENNVPVFMGEFGVVKTVPVEFRGAWTKAVKETAEEMGFSWSYWELASHFGIFDNEENVWDQELLEILVN